MKRTHESRTQLIDTLLVTLIVFSAALMLISKTVADDPFPAPGDCTHVCQMRSDFHLNNGAANGYVQYSVPDCLFCTAPAGRCQYDTAIGPNCIKNNVDSVFRACTGGTDICVLGDGTTYVDATCTGCVFASDKKQNECSNAPVPLPVPGP